MFMMMTMMMTNIIYIYVLQSISNTYDGYTIYMYYSLYQIRTIDIQSIAMYYSLYQIHTIYNLYLCITVCITDSNINETNYAHVQI